MRVNQGRIQMFACGKKAVGTLSGTKSALIELSRDWIAG
jgi:hypothetical protein